MVKMIDFGLCSVFGFLFVSFCASSLKNKPNKNNKYTIMYEWSVVNFTWHNTEEYQKSVIAKRYIPENNFISGLKIYDGFVYVSLPRLQNGTPVTLAYLPLVENPLRNDLLAPFPNWDMNVQSNCSTLQNVRAFEIDKFGVMWLLDGVRVNDLTDCPSKLVLLDLNNYGTVMHTFQFPDTICSKNGCFLYNIVVDDRDGGYAFITDHSILDPGIIVYSRHKDRAWKLRDRSMFPEVKDKLVVDDIAINNMAPVAGIALSPTPTNNKQDKFVYYSTLSGYNIYSLNSKVLKNERYCRSGKWRKDVAVAGKKTCRSDGMIIDNKGNLYLSFLTKHNICRWNRKKGFSDNVKVVAKDPAVISWADSFAFDSAGNMYVSVVGTNRFYSPIPRTNIKYRILKIPTGTSSYIDS